MVPVRASILPDRRRSTSALSHGQDRKRSRPVSGRPPLQTTSHGVEEGALAGKVDADLRPKELSSLPSSPLAAPLSHGRRAPCQYLLHYSRNGDSTGIPAAISGETPLTSAGRFAEDLAPGREVQAMTNRRQLIRNASCWAVALSLATALSTTESEAQPSGRPPSGPRPPSGRPPGPPRRRRGRRWGFGPRKHCWWGPHGRHCKWW